MTERDEILKRLRSQERPTVHQPAWRSSHQFEDLAQRFDESLTAAGGEVMRAPSLPRALDLLDGVLRELRARRVAANAEPPLTEVDLPARWPDIEWRRADGQGDDLRAFCAIADAGISGADAALAETGSVVISSGPGRSRLVTLLPPVHVVLMPTSRLTSDLFTWTAGGQGAMASAITLVSGPSKTADIEQVLTTGVHGPKRLVVLLYEA